MGPVSPMSEAPDYSSLIAQFGTMRMHTPSPPSGRSHDDMDPRDKARASRGH